MTVTWRGAVSYALTVVVVSWLIGAAVDLAWSAASGGLGMWASFWLKEPWQGVFLGAATVSLTLARRLMDPLPRWRVMLVDGSVYLAALLVCWGVAAWVAGDGAPVDAAFFMATLALFTLQLPAAWLLCVWRSGSLEVVLDELHGGLAAR
ncbi:hypothetical protein GCM10022403_064250 [Streptomyces coacervatus]|uniref:Uncharacterized protein n=1 Tax=Streptomyces coacervatus TaxID=647381 RepID=A0ABP7IMG0_9ACTN|nr:hypothetical protein [Streptomyces coacervatus]MDF2268770.1 hypothetical protein [Streptomyces coacervatus]